VKHLLVMAIFWCLTSVRLGTAACMCLVAVVVAFFICWAPFHTQRLMSAYANSAAAAAAAAESDVSKTTAATSSNHVDDEQQFTGQSVGDLVFFYVSGVLYYVSSVINPILYNIMSVKFRQAFVDTILHCRCRRRGRRDEFASRLTLAGDGPTGGQGVRRYRFAAAGGAGRQSLEPPSSDVGSLRQQNAELEDVHDEVQPLSSSPGNGRQVHQLHDAVDNIVLVDMHNIAARATCTPDNCSHASARR